MTGGVHELFEAHAARTPEALALTCGVQTLTYAELNTRANRLANTLRARGVGPESTVGVCLDRGVDLVVSLLAVVKAGGGYVPLDPAYPARRLAHIVADTAPRLVITRPDLAAVLGDGHRGDLLAVADGAGAAGTDPRVPSHEDNLMYVIHTSGSTGHPKGVCVSHRNVRRLLSAAAEHFDFGPHDTWTLCHSFAFDFSVWELWGALAHGGRLVVVPSATTRSPDALLELLVRERVTVLNQTPGAFRGLVAAAIRGDRRLRDLALRWVVFGGERFEPAALAGWARRFGMPALVNMYGITETTVHVTAHRVRPAELVAAAPSRIGRALADLRVHALDPGLAPVREGVVGELYVGGAGLARGYLNRPALTAERFVPDPHGPPGARMYRTGDRAAPAAGGFEFRGRADNQVKVRGFRIELGEVESALAGLPGVGDVAVVARQAPGGDVRLAAFVTGRLPTTEIRNLLADVLPAHAIPASVSTVDTLPLTANGKVDRAALATRVPRTRPVLRAPYRAPDTATERAVALLWADLLGIDGLGADDDFFELGGDSSTGARILDHLRDRYGVEVSPLAFYRDPTPAGLARAVVGHGRAAVTP